MKLEKSNQFFAEAKDLIPCQTQTLSKGYTQFVQGVSPIFLEKGKGCRVWDADGNEFIDYPLGLGPITLGYNYSKVNQAIKKQLKKGISFSLPHSLEIELAKKIKKIIPCAEMVRYSKNGTDVTSAAVRLARSITEREKIAYCGYHGGSADWFGITTGLNKGIPLKMKDYILKFEYNGIETLEQIFKDNHEQIAAVIMEPVTFELPKNNFLEKVKEITHKNKALLIFDEMVTGFRVSLGGAQEYYKVIPDLATFGKGIANGMPLSLLVGKKEYMNECENIFFSMTFGGETLSLAAAIATLEEMEKKKVIDHFWIQGAKLKLGYNNLAEKYGISKYTQCIGLPVHTQFEFKDDKGEVWWELKSLFLQEMVKRGILCSGVNNICYSHKNRDLSLTLKAVEDSFIILKKAIDSKEVEKYIEGIAVKPVFKTTTR